MQRNWFRAGLIFAACLVLQAARKEFWESKEPASWSAEEKQLLLDQSPWAKDGFARMEVEKKKRGDQGYGSNGQKGGGSMPDMKPGAQPGGQSTYAIGEEIPRVPSNDPGPPVQFRVVARWETAKPVQLAGGPEVPEVTGQFYVIRLRGLPLMPPPKLKKGQAPVNPNEGMLQLIKEGSRLERKDKPPILCDHLFTGSGDRTNEVLLFFPRGEDPITVKDKLVTLESRFTPFHLSIKFPLKEMMYQGGLTL